MSIVVDASAIVPLAMADEDSRYSEAVLEFIQEQGSVFAGGSDTCPQNALPSRGRYSDTCRFAEHKRLDQDGNGVYLSCYAHRQLLEKVDLMASSIPSNCRCHPRNSGAGQLLFVRVAHRPTAQLRLPNLHRSFTVTLVSGSPFKRLVREFQHLPFTGMDDVFEEHIAFAVIRLL